MALISILLLAVEGCLHQAEPIPRELDGESLEGFQREMLTEDFGGGMCHGGLEKPKRL